MSPTPGRPAVRAFVMVLALCLVLLPAVVPAQAHVTQDFNHLWTEHIKPLLADQGTINQSSNPVDWTKLKSVPASIADGQDYPLLLGTGLQKTGFGAGLALDTTIMQKRVNGTCAAGSAIRVIAREGTVTCNPGPAGFGGFKNDTGPLCNEACTEGFMNVPAGSYAIFAKMYLAGSVEEGFLRATCVLDVGSEFFIDRSDVFVDHVLSTHVLSLMGVSTFPGQGYIGVNCDGVGDGFYLRINAIRLGALSNVELQIFDR